MTNLPAGGIGGNLKVYTSGTPTFNWSTEGSPARVIIVAVGGGGQGGGSDGSTGGGGGGGQTRIGSFAISGDLNIIVGAGGSSSIGSNAGEAGGNTSISGGASMTAIGGSGGKQWWC